MRLGLVVEGGGMRGVISSAAADALYQFGYAECFDCVFGTSAGAINGAYLLSGEITKGTSIYYENLVGSRFIDSFRWPDLMDLDYLFDECIQGLKSLDVETVVSSPVPLTITATDVHSGEPRFFLSRSLDASDLLRALKASASAPLATTNTECIEGRYYNDGAVHHAIPLEPALRAGCTHILCLLTQRRGFRKRRFSLRSPLEFVRLRKYGAAYRRAALHAYWTYNAALEQIAREGDDGVAILAIAPEEADFAIGNSETRERELLRATKESMARTARCLGEDPAALSLFRDA